MTLRRSKALKPNPERVRAWTQRSRKPLPRMSARRRRELPVRAVVRAAVLERDEVCLLAHHSPCFGPPTFHHRRKAGQGGAYSMENGARLCAFHNDQLEADADLAAYARSIGLVLRREDVA